MIVADGKPGVDALAAYVTMQVALTNPTHDARANAGTYSYDYLSLPALLEHIAKPRREAGLAVAQEVAGDVGTVSVTTYLIHLSGGWLAFGPAVFPAPADPQKRGAVISYARRYALLAALGLAAEDDDAARASGGGTTASASEPVGKADDDDWTGVDPPTDTAGSETSTDASPTLPPSTDARLTQQRYHPGKPHRLVSSPHAPSMMICAQDAGEPCTFNKVVGS